MLIVGDPHLKITRFELTKQFLKWIEGVALATRPDVFVNLGDTFDTHGVLRAELMEEFRQHVLSVVRMGCTYHYLLGNHDFYKPNSSKYHALQSFKGLHKDFTVIDEIMDIAGITYVPYQVDLNTFPKQTRDICFAHQTFIGADYGFKRADAGVNADEISADIIISGHVHGKQQFGKVYYPGTPYSQTVDDVNQVKGVHLFDTETYSMEFIECPLPQWKGLKFELDQSYSVVNLQSDLEALLDNKNHWIIDIAGPKAEILAYLSSKPFLSLKKGIDLRTRVQPNDKEKERTQIKSIKPEDIISEYVEKVYKGSLDREVIRKTASQILAKVRST